MKSHFTAEFFTGNRARLQATLGREVPIVITANGVMQRGGDEPSPFYQDSNFWYLTGISAPDLVLVITSVMTYLIVPELSAVRVAFDGAHDFAAYSKQSGITQVVTAREGWTKLKAALAKSGAVATLPSLPAHLKQHGVYSLPFRHRLIEKLKRLNPGLTVRDIRPELATLRSIKQPPELSALQAAIDVTTTALGQIAKNYLAAASYEYEIEAALSYSFRRQGSEGHGFAPIVGAGMHSTTLHHMQNNGAIAKSDVVVLDVGASVEHYSADITRTVSKQPLTGRAADIFRAVADVQEFALSQLKPGVLPRDYELSVEAYMGQQLQSLGLISRQSREQIRRYFPHATSHFLGLDTHDAGDYRAPLQPGMVITCEPGIYVPEEGMGVRIEDDILITDDGYRNLSAACPRELTPVQ